MRRRRWVLVCAAMGAVMAPRAAAQAPGPCCTADVLRSGLAVADRYRVAAIATRRFTHARFWAAVAPSLESGAFTVAEAGRSLQGRPLRTVTFGAGPVKVLLWSQMHGDESAATMALADIFAFLAASDADSLRERLRRTLTVTFLPMVNPDGAQLFQRGNAAGIDINRDARGLATPEARALSQLQRRFAPDFGFNLHDQNARARVGGAGLQVAIALLAPAYDSARGWNDTRARARLVAAGIAQLLSHDIPGRVARYDDTFGPRAFGDEFQRRGTSTVLIESGALPGDPQKQRLRALNVAAILAALDAIGSGSYAGADTNAYEGLPENTDGARDLLILGGQLVLPGAAPFRSDIAVNFDDAVARTSGRIAEVGDLRDAVGVDTLDATGLYLHPARSSLRTVRGARWLRLGAPAVFELRRGAGRRSELVERVP